MASPDRRTSLTPVRGHGRHGSADERRRVARLRASTRGPLDEPFSDPLHTPDTPPTSRSPAPTASKPGSSISSPTIRSAGSEQNQPKDLSFLLDASIYHPVPSQNVPPQFLSSSHAAAITSPLSSLLSNGHYRLAAQACARLLTTSVAPTDTTTILSLFETRLSCLSLLNLHDLAAQESKALGDLSSNFYYNPLNGSHVIPWSLRVLCVRLAALGYGEWRKGIMGFYDLARDAREVASRTNSPSDNALWQSRLRDLGVRVANILVEMGDLEGAARHLATLGPVKGTSEDNSNNPDAEAELARIRTMEAMVWLRLGDINAATRCTADILPADTSSPLSALIKLADRDYDAAIEEWEKLNPDENPMVCQNLALCLLYTGRLSEAREQLESLIKRGYSFHALTFNLSTVYELCTEKAKNKKLDLIENLAARPPNADTLIGSWEMMATDFKL